MMCPHGRPFADCYEDDCADKTRSPRTAAVTYLALCLCGSPWFVALGPVAIDTNGQVVAYGRGLRCASCGDTKRVGYCGDRR